MKFFITKAEYDALTPEQQAMYKGKGDGYQMNITGLPDDSSEELTTLRNQVNTLLDEAKKAKATGKAAEEAKRKAEEEAARKAGDIEAIEKGWADKLRVEQEAHTATKSKYGNQVHSLMVGNVAADISRKVFGDNAPALEHWVKARLTLEEGSDGTFKTRVIGADGKPSALSLDELSNELRSNDMFKPFITDTKSQSVNDLLKGGKDPVKTEPGKPIDNVQLARDIISGMGD